jgi:hypothetical protein
MDKGVGGNQPPHFEKLRVATAKTNSYPYPNILIPLANGTIHVSILK